MTRRERSRSAPPVDARWRKGIRDTAHKPAEVFTGETAGVGVREEAEVAEGWEGLGCRVGVGMGEWECG